MAVIIDAVSVELLALFVILEHEIKHVEDAVLHIRIVDWRGDLDTAGRISRHEVGRRDIQFLCITLSEDVDSRMLEEPADNADDRNVVGLALYPRAETADTADDELDLHTSLARFDQLVDDCLIGERVDLRTDVGFLSFVRKHDLFIHHIENLVL